MSVSKECVASFLKEFKQLAVTNKIIFVSRLKNHTSLIKLGFTKQNCSQEILSLSVANYVKGPDADHDPSKSGDIWCFGKRICGAEIYIKLKIFKVEKQLHAKCISFHEAEHSIIYPY